MNNIKTQSITVSPIIKKRGRPKRFPPQYVPKINFENFGNIQELEKALVIKKNSVNEIQQYIRNECNNPHEALVLAKTYLSSQSYGGVMESFFKRFFNLTKINESQDGDLLSSTLGNLEIKVSIEFPSKDNVCFCMMQLRPAHNVDYYLGVFYSYTQSEIKYVLIPSKEMKSIISKYCSSFSHGTKKGKKKSPKELIDNDTEAEFQITFSTTPSKNQPYQVWIELESFVYSEQEIKNKIK